MQQRLATLRARVDTHIMLSTLRKTIVPDSQRRSTEELTNDLDLTVGDRQSKISAFWLMLIFSAFIAAAGVLGDSTATVIGAMIIAPLATPIMGIALGIAKREPGGASRAGRFVLFGGLTVIGVGVVFAVLTPTGYDLLGNSQIAGRTSPGMTDLIAAVATGFAGAVALTRRDVAAILPGVAIAISLVPPLAVVGICLGQGSVSLALGALLLFVSNLLALVLAGTLVFATLVIDTERPTAGASRRKAYLTIGLLMTVVAVPLIANSVATYAVTMWVNRTHETATEWVSQEPGATVSNVDFVSNKMTVTIQTPGDTPPVSNLLTELEGKIPNGVPVVVVTSVGQEIEAGVVGE